VIRGEPGRFQASRTLHPDNWVIHGCPVNGPAMAAEGDRVALAWFTAPGDEARVKVAFSKDGGASFGDPVVVDAGRPLGRVGVTLADGKAYVVWMEEADEGMATVEVRRVTRKGKVSKSRRIARTSAERASGFPQIARIGDRLVVAWTEAEDPPRVVTVMLPLG
jgi:hypothetical protein